MALKRIPGGLKALASLSIAEGDSVVSKEGSQIIESGLDFSAFTTSALVDWTIGPGSAIKTRASAPLLTGITGIFRNNSTSGTFYIEPAGNSGVLDIDELVHNGNGTTAIIGSSKKVVDCRCIDRGLIEIGDGVEVTNLVLGSGSGSIRQGYNSTANTSWAINGGRFMSERGLAGSGFIGHNARALVRLLNTNATRPTHTSGTLRIAGYLGWAGGNMNDVELEGDGMLDLSDVEDDITIASLTGPTWAIQRSKLESKHPGVTITISSGPTYSDGGTEADYRRVG